MRLGCLWINPFPSCKDDLFLTYWLGCLGLGGRTSSFSISSSSSNFSCSYLTGVEWRWTAPYGATFLYLIFSGSPLISFYLTPKLRSALRMSSMPIWCKSCWLLTIDLESYLKVLPGILSLLTTASPFSIQVKISCCSVIVFRSLWAFCRYTPGIFQLITLAIWGDNALAWADLFVSSSISSYCFSSS